MIRSSLFRNSILTLTTSYCNMVCKPSFISLPPSPCLFSSSFLFRTLFAYTLSDQLHYRTVLYLVQLSQHRLPINLVIDISLLPAHIRMFTLRPTTPEPRYYAYNWAECGNNQPLREEYLPPYLRRPYSAMTTAPGPGSYVAQRASTYADNTTIAMSWEMDDVVPMDGEPRNPPPSMHRHAPARFTILGTSKFQTEAYVSYKAKADAEAQTASEKKKDKKKSDGGGQQPYKPAPTAQNPASALGAIFGDYMQQPGYHPWRRTQKAHAAAHAYGSVIPLVSHTALPPSEDDLEPSELLSMIYHVGDFSLDNFRYTYTLHRAGINVLPLPVVSQELPASDSRRKAFINYKNEIMAKVDDILDLYRFPKIRFIQPCGRKRALHLMERPIPTIVISVMMPAASPLDMKLAVRDIAVMLYGEFGLRGVAIEIIHRALEDRNEHPVPVPPDPSSKNKEKLLDWRCASRITPPLWLLNELVNEKMYGWDPHTLELIPLPKSV